MSAIAYAEKTLTGANQFVVLRLPAPVFNISIGGTWAGTITLQRSFNGQDWYDVWQFTANDQKVGDDPEENINYRLGFKAGDYTSGSAFVRISQ